MFNRLTKILTSKFFVALIGVVIGFSSQGSQAQSMNLKVTHFFPNTHWLWTEAYETFQEKVRNRTEGNLEFSNFHAGQLGKITSSVMKSGMADMGIFVPSYEASQLPLSSVAELPGNYATSCEGTTKLWNISKPGEALSQAEYEPQGFRVLFVLALHPYHLMTTETEVTSLEDVDGLKVRANGGAMSKVARELGAVPIQVANSELYDAATRGTIDGALWALASTREQGLDRALKYTVRGPQLGAGSIVYAINLEAWNRLSESTKSVFQEVASEVQQQLCTYADNRLEEQLNWLVDKRGLVVNELDDDELRRWENRLSGIEDEWAKEMDSSGRPGSKILEAFKAGSN